LDVRLEHVVTAIDWSDAGVTVTTDRGTFSGASAVVTLPIGVLKSGDVTITPPLPDTHQRVLGVLAANAFEKVVLRFPERFWDAGVYGI
ncbi:FAD-dependent oxidoreductase, partial [Enterococcus faecalis]|uniref:FAD-dependent oxidoreductase n=2 Tax=Bacillati TaxID=1783272 RepID=UPI00403F8137